MTARNDGIEDAAKFAKTWLEDWGCDLQGTSDEYREAMSTGTFAGRKIPREIAKINARQFQERADAVYDCGENLAEAIRGLKS